MKMSVSKDAHVQTDVEYEESVARGGVACPFPWRLHKCLADCADHHSDIISWAPHGRSFTVHKPKVFVEAIMPRYFGQTKFPSFQRQLNLYGFSRFAHGKDKGSYYHFCFVRGHPQLVHHMVRRKVKGNKVRHTIEASSEPDFYHEAWVNHFEGSYPPKLLEIQCAAVVRALCEKAMSDALNKPTSDLLQIPSAVFENGVFPVSPPGITSETTDQIMIISSLQKGPHTISPDPSSLLSGNDSNDGASLVSIDDAVKDGDVVTFEGIPFHYLDGNKNHDLHNSTLSTIGTEEDTGSICSLRRCVSSTCFDTFQDQDPFLNSNLTAVL